MKKLYTLLSAIAISATVSAQGTIMGFMVSPPAPTTMDNVYMYVNVQFGSSNCDVDTQGHSTSTGSTSAYAHHCLGMLSAICNHIDTFNLGMLPAGPHVFDMTLTSGFGGPGCTAGIVPDDNRNTTFTVTTATGISHLQSDENLVSLFPNPVTTTATIRISNRAKLQNAELKIMDVTGRTVRTIPNIQSNEIPVTKEDLPSGVYFYQLTEAGESVKGKFVVQ